MSKIGVHLAVAAAFVGLLAWAPSIADATPPAREAVWDLTLDSRPPQNCIELEGEESYGGLGGHTPDPAPVIVRIRNTCEQTFELEAESCSVESCTGEHTCPIVTCSSGEFEVSPGMTEAMVSGDAGASDTSKMATSHWVEGSLYDVHPDGSGGGGDSGADIWDPFPDDTGTDDTSLDPDVGYDDTGGGADASDGGGTDASDAGGGRDGSEDTADADRRDGGVDDARADVGPSNRLDDDNSVAYRISDLGISGDELHERTSTVDITFRWELGPVEDGTFDATLEYTEPYAPSSGGGVCGCSAPTRGPVGGGTLPALAAFLVGVLALRKSAHRS